MANTIDSALIVKNLLQKSIQIQAPALPKVQSYCTILDLGPVTGRTATVPVISSVQAVVENPTSFENSGDNVGVAQVTPVHLSAQFGLANADQASGLDTPMLLASHLTKMQMAIQAKIFALLTAANYGNALTVSSAAYAEASMQTLLNAVAGRTCIALDTAWWSKTKRDWMPYGAEAALNECSDWTGAETNTHGFVASPEIVTAMSIAGDLCFNPLTDSLINEDGVAVRLDPPTGVELPPKGFEVKDAGFQAPAKDGSKVQVHVSPTSNRLQLLKH